MFWVNFTVAIRISLLDRRTFLLLLTQTSRMAGKGIDIDKIFFVLKASRQSFVNAYDADCPDVQPANLRLDELSVAPDDNRESSRLNVSCGGPLHAFRTDVLNGCDVFLVIVVRQPIYDH